MGGKPHRRRSREEDDEDERDGPDVRPTMDTEKPRTPPQSITDSASSNAKRPRLSTPSGKRNLLSDENEPNHPYSPPSAINQNLPTKHSFILHQDAPSLPAISQDRGRDDLGPRIEIRATPHRDRPPSPRGSAAPGTIVPPTPDRDIEIQSTRSSRNRRRSGSRRQQESRVVTRRGSRTSGGHSFRFHEPGSRIVHPQPTHYLPIQGPNISLHGIETPLSTVPLTRGQQLPPDDPRAPLPLTTVTQQPLPSGERTSYAALSSASSSRRPSSQYAQGLSPERRHSGVWFTTGPVEPSRDFRGWTREQQDAYNAGVEDAIRGVEHGFVAIGNQWYRNPIFVSREIPSNPNDPNTYSGQVSQRQQLHEPRWEQHDPVPGEPGSSHQHSRHPSMAGSPYTSFGNQQVDSRMLATTYRPPGQPPPFPYNAMQIPPGVAGVPQINTDLRSPIRPDEFPPSSSSSSHSRPAARAQPRPSRFPDPPMGMGPGKGQRQSISCYPCRERKMKCDDKRPCNQCIKRGTQDKCFFADHVRRRGKAKQGGGGSKASEGELTSVTPEGHEPDEGVPSGESSRRPSGSKSRDAVDGDGNDGEDERNEEASSSWHGRLQESRPYEAAPLWGTRESSLPLRREEKGKTVARDADSDDTRR